MLEVLSDAGIRITAVVSDARGVAATAIIDCLLAGGTPEQGLTHAGRLQAAPETLLASLRGELSAEHRFVAQTIRHHIHYLDARLADLEGPLLEALQPHEAAMQFLLTIPGIDRLAAAKSIIEIGIDMAAFGTAGRLCKGPACVPAMKRAPANTGGAIPLRAIAMSVPYSAKSRGPRSEPPVNSRAVVQSLVGRRGTERVIVAIGHTVLKTVFVLLSRQVPYQDSTVDDEALAVHRHAPRWIRQLRKFGYLPKMA